MLMPYEVIFQLNWKKIILIEVMPYELFLSIILCFLRITWIAWNKIFAESEDHTVNSNHLS